MFKFIDDDLRRVYHAMVKYLDDVVGGVHMVNALIGRGLRDDLFVTGNDNGGLITFDAGTKNYPLKGGKHSDWQGGVRVNAFVTGGQKTELKATCTLWTARAHLTCGHLYLDKLTPHLKQI